MHDTLALHDVEPTDATMRRLAAALVQGHEDARTELATAGRVLPGAKETLAALAADHRVHQAVLGDDHTVRAELVAIAQHRATVQMGSSFDKEHTVLIGDTPKDVEAALTAGVLVIAVASGKNNETELTKAGAFAAIADLTDTASVVRLVTGEPNIR
jgi:phosphoglycolate phosphatase-like HAD superfamily hydrolase